MDIIPITQINAIILLLLVFTMLGAMVYLNHKRRTDLEHYGKIVSDYESRIMETEKKWFETKAELERYKSYERNGLMFTPITGVSEPAFSWSKITSATTNTPKEATDDDTPVYTLGKRPMNVQMEYNIINPRAFEILKGKAISLGKERSDNKKHEQHYLRKSQNKMWTRIRMFQKKRVEPVQYDFALLEHDYKRNLDDALNRFGEWSRDLEVAQIWKNMKNLEDEEWKAGF